VSENLVHQWLFRAGKLEGTSSSPNEPAGEPGAAQEHGPAERKGRSVLAHHYGLYQRQGFTRPARTPARGSGKCNFETAPEPGV
jgi:hypothetical protein